MRAARDVCGELQGPLQQQGEAVSLTCSLAQDPGAVPLTDQALGPLTLGNYSLL